MNAKTINFNKVDAAAAEYLKKVKEHKVLGNHDMILFCDDYEFHLANKELVKLSECPSHILRAYRIDSLGNLNLA